MKSIISIFILSILTITTITSQKKVQFGLKGGINFTNMSLDHLFDKEYKTGFHIGGLVEIPFSPKFSLQPEILYSTQGVDGKAPSDANISPGLYEPFSVEYNFNYIQVPVLAKFYLFDSFSLEIGPSFNFLIKDEIKYSYSDDTVIINPESNDVGETFEFSGIVGFSYKIKSGFFTYLRYNQGFTDVLTEDVWEGKNYGFMLGVGYMF